MSRIDKHVVNAVYRRAGCDDPLAGDWPHCEGCGASAATHRIDLHHRQARGMGGGSGEGVDTVENLVLLHHECHMHVHAHPELSRRLGLIVPRGTDPAGVPVTVARNLRELRT